MVTVNVHGFRLKPMSVRQESLNLSAKYNVTRPRIFELEDKIQCY